MDYKPRVAQKFTWSCICNSNAEINNSEKIDCKKCNNKNDVVDRIVVRNEGKLKKQTMSAARQTK